MKGALLVVCLCLGSVAAFRVRREEKYTSKFDNVDVDSILKSDRLLQNYANCLLDKGKCTPDGAELKRILPDALETACSKCNEKQKATTEKVLRYLIENRAALFGQLEQKYDPSGTYRKRYTEEAKKRGIEIPTPKSL